MSKYVVKNNLAFTTQRCCGLLEVGVVADRFGNTLFEVVHTTPEQKTFRLYFEKFESVTDYIHVNFTRHERKRL